MAYSYVPYPGNGSTTQFAVAFPYIRKEHVYVTVDGVNTAYTWVNDSLIQLASAPANGKEVIVRRVTPVASRLVDYTDGSTLVAADLDTDSLQHLYTEQELTDNVGPVADLRGVYFGVYASDPTQSPFGQPLQSGDLYYNNTLQSMRVYTGSQWKNATGASVITRFVYTLTVGQSSVSGADLAGAILAYSPGLEMVFANGFALTRGLNYTATDGTSITGLSIATTTKVEVLAVSPLDGVNSISGSSIADNTITSAKIFNGTIVDGDISSAAAISHSKLAFMTAGSVMIGNFLNQPQATALTGDVTINSSGVTSIGSGVIVNADINASAAIAGTKINPNFGSQNIATTGTLTAAAGVAATGSITTGSDFVATVGNVTAVNVNASANLSFNSGYGSTAIAYGCRAWVNFDGATSGTFAGGVSAVTRTAGSTTATVTTTSAHGLTTGNRVYVPASQPVVAGFYTVTVTSSTVFTITTVATTAISAAAIIFNVKNIRASGNVSSIAYGGTGDYSINFATAMPDANYSWTGSVGYLAGTSGSVYSVELPDGQAYGTSVTTGYLHVQTQAVNSGANRTLVDLGLINVMVFR